MTMSADWATISSLATAGGTLVLAVATFASVRSGNRAARAAERSLLIGIRPLLMPSHPQDVEQKIMFVDSHWVKAPGGGATAEAVDGAIYLTLSLRNAGSGMAVLHGWVFHPDRILENTHPAASDFRRLARDIYVPASNIGFWQGTFRDPQTDEFAIAAQAINARNTLTIDLLYGDHEGGQRTISRFAVIPRTDGGWFCTVGRHWNLDRADPR
ncbi:MAG: hypothetical protein E6I76_08285 [Chloroflexi bacterium]|nr:MAG: hypothetical protein E6I76_08285 [Chloroflexota bacterium]